MSIPTRVQQAIADGLSAGYVTPTALTRSLAPALGVSGATDGDLFRAIRAELQRQAKEGIIRSKLAGRDGERFFLPNSDEDNAPAPPSDRLLNDRIGAIFKVLEILSDQQTRMENTIAKIQETVNAIGRQTNVISRQVSQIDTSLPTDDTPDY